jgi:hypothetical protein
MKCRWSPTLGGGFEKTPYEAWGVEKYDPDKDINEPTVFCGMYGLSDFHVLYNHKGKKYVWWVGSDIRYLMAGYKVDDINNKSTSRGIAGWINRRCESWCENQVEYEALKEMGIESKVAPSFLGDVDDFPEQKIPLEETRFYSSVSGDDFKLYGWDRINEMAKLFPENKFYLYGNTKPWKAPKNVIVRGRVSNKEMNDETKKMAGVVRYVRFEGFSEIVCKAILWGQQVMSDIPYNYTRESLLKVLNKYPWNERIMRKIVIDKNDNVICKEGRVPLEWSWEETTDKDMPAKAFILYIPMRDGMEMRQIYVSRKNRKEGIGSKILKIFEEKSKELGKSKAYIKVHFTDHDPDNIFQDFLKRQGYKQTETDLWTKEI